MREFYPANLSQSSFFDVIIWTWRRNIKVKKLCVQGLVILNFNDLSRWELIIYYNFLIFNPVPS